MAFKTKKVGASRNAVQKPREIVNWQQRFKKGLTVLVFITVLGGGGLFASGRDFASFTRDGRGRVTTHR